MFHPFFGFFPVISIAFFGCFICQWNDFLSKKQVSWDNNQLKPERLWNHATWHREKTWDTYIVDDRLHFPYRWYGNNSLGFHSNQYMRINLYQNYKFESLTISSIKVYNHFNKIIRGKDNLISLQLHALCLKNKLFSIKQLSALLLNRACQVSL